MDAWEKHKKMSGNEIGRIDKIKSEGGNYMLQLTTRSNFVDQLVSLSEGDYRKEGSWITFQDENYDNHDDDPRMPVFIYFKFKDTMWSFQHFNFLSKFCYFKNIISL